jgi:hypothetical protein
MYLWIIGVIACLLLFAAIVKRNLIIAGGVLIGVALAWMLSRLLEPYLSGAEHVPLWLPPLPLATIATILFVYAVLVWIRGNDALPKPKDKDPHGHH